MKTRFSTRWIVIATLMTGMVTSFATCGMAQEENDVRRREQEMLRERLLEEGGPPSGDDRGGEMPPRPQDGGPPQPGRTADPLSPEKMQHAHLALMHLRAAGLEGEARRLERLIQRQMQRPGQPRFQPEPGSPGEMGPRPEFGPWGQAAQMQLEQLHQAIGGLRASVEQLEQRTRRSDDIARAVDDAHRQIQRWQRETEERTESVEKNLRIRMKELEQSLNGQWKEQRQNMIEYFQKQLELAKEAAAHRSSGRRSHHERVEEADHDDDHDDDEEEEDEDDDSDEDDDEEEHD